MADQGPLTASSWNAWPHRACTGPVSGPSQKSSSQAVQAPLVGPIDLPESNSLRCSLVVENAPVADDTPVGVTANRDLFDYASAVAQLHGGDTTGAVAPDDVSLAVAVGIGLERTVLRRQVRLSPVDHGQTVGCSRDRHIRSVIRVDIANVQRVGFEISRRRCTLFCNPAAHGLEVKCNAIAWISHPGDGPDRR